jgi:hypothetical protein
VLCLAITGPLGVVSAYFERAEIDRFASGRVSIWQGKFQLSFSQGNDAKTLLIGPDRLPVNPTGGYDLELRKDKKFRKFHADNAYLELFFEAGVIGAVLFLFPYFFILRLVLARVRRNRDRMDIWASAVLLGVGAQSVFITTIPTFANPVAFLVLSATAIALGVLRRDSSEPTDFRDN